MENENKRFTDEAVGSLRFPEKDKVVCKDCVFAAKDKKIGSDVIDGATFGCCDAYEIKPPSILLDGKECMYHLSESDGEETEDEEQ